VITFQKQPIMRRVLIALAPIWLHTLWLYGLRALALGLVSLVLAVGTEWLFERKRSGKVSEAILVTAALYGLALPPRTPLWIAAVGIVFATSMAKAVYGGFGRNLFNPAIAGRLFVYISFATTLNLSYGAPGAFGTRAVDVTAAATPLALMRSGGSAQPALDLLVGNRPGAVGEGMILLVVLAGIYLVWTKTASWRIILAELVAASALNAALYFGGVPGALPMESLLAGSFLFTTVFMSTDPVSAPKKPLSQLIYGALIGLCIVAIRSFSAFPEGTSFGILLGNTFASLIDELVPGKRKAAAGPAKPAATAPGGTT
jgi:Na+-transporting NADH:ubiquinone oxidoreductase subunit B